MTSSGMTAAVQAVRDASWDAPDEGRQLRTGVMIGSGIGGLTTIAETAVLIKEKGPKLRFRLLYSGQP
jgi:3-oxoacyl-[acyl-carrier-protein] synthase II